MYDITIDTKCDHCKKPLTNPLEVYPGPVHDDLDSPEFVDYCELCYMKLFQEDTSVL